MPQDSGSQTLTADGVVGDSGAPTRVFSATWICDNTTNVNLVLRNGTSASGAVYVQQAGTNGKSVTQNWHNGLFFPGGCFFDIDADVDSATIEYRTEL